MKNIKHVCFDLDGVIIDSSLLSKKSWEYSISNLDIDIPFENFQTYSGLKIKDILNKLEIDNDSVEIIEAKFEQFSNTNLSFLKIFEGITDVLTNFDKDGICLSIFTSKPFQRALDALEYFEIRNYFKYVLSTHQLTNDQAKPSPYGVIEICKKTSQKLENTIYIGDTIFDKKLAGNANILFGLAKWGYGNDIHSEIEFETPLELGNYIFGVN